MVSSSGGYPLISCCDNVTLLLMVEGYVIATSTLYASPLSSFLINTTFIFNLKRVKHSHPFFSRTCQIINPHSKSFNMGCELEDIFIKKTQENCFIANQKPTSMQKQTQSSL